MKILAIIGSPRKGHTYRIVQQIEQMLGQNPGMTFEYVFLSQLNLQPCRGCYVCQSRGEQFCPLKDDLPVLVQKMKTAEGVIFASPAYTGNVPALMKNLMDRMAYFAHRPAFLGKPAMLVATASSGTADTLKALGWFRYTGFEVVSKLGIPVWPSHRLAWQGGKTVDQKIERAVARFERFMTRPTVSPSLGQVFQFYNMKATAMTDPKFFAADFAYHQDIDQLNGKVHPWKKALGQLYFWIAMRWLSSSIRPVKRRLSPSDTMD
jgi:multimeric flavodoxin WrbA